MLRIHVVYLGLRVGGSVHGCRSQCGPGACPGCTSEQLEEYKFAHQRFGMNYTKKLAPERVILDGTRWSSHEVCEMNPFCVGGVCGETVGLLTTMGDMGEPNPLHTWIGTPNLLPGQGFWKSSFLISGFITYCEHIVYEIVICLPILDF